MKKVLAWTVLTASMCAAQWSQAAPVTVSFSAVVTSTNSGLATAGSTLTGTMTFGDAPTSVETPPPVACSAAACATYRFESRPADVFVKLGNALISSNILGVGVYDNATLFTADGSPVDALELGTKLNGPSYLLTLTSGPNAISGVGLSDALTLLSSWQGGQFTVWWSAAAAPALQARVTNVSVSSVPEPTTVGLFAMGLGGVLAVGTRRRRVSSTPQAVNDA